MEEKDHSRAVENEMSVPVYEDAMHKNGSFVRGDIIVNDACDVLLPVGIHLRVTLEEVFPSGSTAAYINHSVGLNANGDWILVAHGSDSYGHTKEMVRAHERAHAKAYFKWLKPWMIDVLPIYLTTKRTKQEIEDFTRHFYDLMLYNRVYLEDSASFSNLASKSWLLDNGYVYVRSDGMVDYYKKK